MMSHNWNIYTSGDYCECPTWWCLKNHIGDTFDASLILTYHDFNEMVFIKVLIIVNISTTYIWFHQPKMSIIPYQAQAARAYTPKCVGTKKETHWKSVSFSVKMSGYCDSNTGPSGPKPDALANCATPRFPSFGTANIQRKNKTAKLFVKILQFLIKTTQKKAWCLLTKGLLLLMLV